MTQPNTSSHTYKSLRETLESHVRKNFPEVNFADYFVLCDTTNYWYTREREGVTLDTNIYTFDKWNNFGFVFDNCLYFARKRYEEVDALAYFALPQQDIVPDYASFDQLNKLVTQMIV